MNLTQWLIFGAFIILLTWTAVSQKLGYPTVSKTLRDWAWKYNSISFTAGMLIGHWFFPTKSPLFTAVGYALPFLGIMALFDLGWHILAEGRRAWYRWPAFSFSAGVIVGILFWGQRSMEGPL